jgi:hypothetical protein
VNVAHGRHARAILAKQLRGRAPLGDCTAATLRCGDAKSHAAELRVCCRAHVRQIVVDAVRELERHGVTFWADYGTLLGAVRNPLTTWADYPWLPQDGKPAGPLAPGIVPHDKDADFGVLWTDWQKLMRVRAALERRGYALRVSPHGAKMKIRLSDLNHTNLDLFSWREMAGVMHRPTYNAVDNYKGRHFPKGALFPLGPITWEGLTLPAPVNPEAFCAFRYGPKWRTPIAANHNPERIP